MKNILITGAAGFIGYSLARELLESNEGVEENIQIVGIDNMNDYYSVDLKKSRLENLVKHRNFRFTKGSISDKELVQKIFAENQFDVVVNLAAQAGVRYSITNPDAYIESNLVGFYNILEACRHSYDESDANPSADYKGVHHLVYASSSSVYGTNEKVPYSTGDIVDNPVSLYAATKKSNELMAYAYSNLYRIPSTGLRFFTVYGPMGRPDMAYFKFTNKIVKGETIQIYNYGDMYRDFTYIDDIVKGIITVMKKAPAKNDNGVPYKIYNIGNNKPVSIMYFIETLEKILMEEGISMNQVKKELLPMQQADVYKTFADVDELIRDFNFKPETPLEVGLRNFAQWYKLYYLIR
jgi:UDP-glucuronate 4-epimerase